MKIWFFNLIKVPSTYRNKRRPIHWTFSYSCWFSIRTQEQQKSIYSEKRRRRRRKNQIGGWERKKTIEQMINGGNVNVDLDEESVKPMLVWVFFEGKFMISLFMHAVNFFIRRNSLSEAVHIWHNKIFTWETVVLVISWKLTGINVIPNINDITFVSVSVLINNAFINWIIIVDEDFLSRRDSNE